MPWESKNVCDLLYCDILFIAGVWHPTTISPRSTYNMFLKWIIRFFKKTTHRVIHRIIFCIYVTLQFPKHSHTFAYRSPLGEG